MPVGFVDSRVSEPCGRRALKAHPWHLRPTPSSPGREHAEYHAGRRQPDIPLPTPLVKGDKALGLTSAGNGVQFRGRQGATSISLAINDPTSPLVVTSADGRPQLVQLVQRNWPQHGIVHLISIGRGTFGTTSVSAARLAIGPIRRYPADHLGACRAAHGGLMIFSGAIGHFTKHPHAAQISPQQTKISQSLLRPTGAFLLCFR